MTTTDVKTAVREKYSEAARRVGVTAQTLSRWSRDGLVPHARDGRVVCGGGV